MVHSAGPVTEKRRLPQHTRILLGLLIGVVAGITINQTLGGEHPAVIWIVRQLTEPVGTLFLRS